MLRTALTTIALVIATLIAGLAADNPHLRGADIEINILFDYASFFGRGF